MWRRALIVLALAGTAHGEPKAVRKAPTEAYPAEAIAAFVEAVLADKAGELSRAASRYDVANRASPQANTFYNLADVQRRLERRDKAVEAYRKYLELAPDAKDAKDVQKLVAQLASQTMVVVDGEAPDAVILVDGKIIGPSPQVMNLPKGSYFLERVGKTSYGYRAITVSTLVPMHESLNGARKAEGGNVIIAGQAAGLGGGWEEDGQRISIPSRLTLPPGKHTLSPPNACAPITFEVPKATDTVVHVFVATQKAVTGCVPLAVKTALVKVGS